MKKSPAHKLLSDIIRFPFGGSNRLGHLRMAKVAAPIAGITAYHYTHSLGLAMIATAGSYYQELWAGSDRDEEEKRKPYSRWWILYGLAIKHRSWLSHGPVGTVTRITWGYLGAPFWMIAWAVFGGSAFFRADWPSLGMGRVGERLRAFDFRCVTASPGSRKQSHNR